MTVLAFVGSLRRASINRGLLRAAYEVGPAGMTFAGFNCGELPHYNADDEADPPAPARNLRERVRSAGAILFVTPEYNYSVPGLLKNVVDWGSQPRGQNVWDDKP